jgi:hypothetical protein
MASSPPPLFVINGLSVNSLPGLRTEDRVISLHTTSWENVSGIKVAQALFFVLVWPSFNLALIASIQLQLGAFDSSALIATSAKLYATFTAAFVLIETTRTLLPNLAPESSFARQLALHMASFFLVSLIFNPMEPGHPSSSLPQLRGIPLIFFLLQVVMYLSVIKIFTQQRRAHAMEMNLRQAQVNLLRSQSNPHFLFNTLNLLGSEITTHPENAVELVYDLADLLRDSMRAGEKPITTVAEEFRLAQLYLRLQSKRFPGRFSFDAKIAGKAGGEEIPSLLLQPVVENAIKHGVAISTEHVHLELKAALGDGGLVVSVSNTGSVDKAEPVVAGNGFRILRETLELHYAGRYTLIFGIRNGEAEIALTIPSTMAKRPV